MKRTTLILALVALVVAPVSRAQVQSDASRFTVGDIRVLGLQRVSEGTVYNYLPVNIGDELTPQRVREALHTLHETGFFRTVELRRDGATLVVAVRERPTIESFEIKGSPLSERAQVLGQQLGIGMLVLLMGAALYNDILRQFG